MGKGANATIRQGGDRGIRDGNCDSEVGFAGSVGCGVGDRCCSNVFDADMLRCGRTGAGFGKEWIVHIAIPCSLGATELNIWWGSSSDLLRKCTAWSPSVRCAID